MKRRAAALPPAVRQLLVDLRHELVIERMNLDEDQAREPHYRRHYRLLARLERQLKLDDARKAAE